MNSLMKVFLALTVLAVCVSPVWAARLPALKMLSTTTCPACKMMSGVLDELDANYKGRLSTEKVYLEDHPDLARQYNVRYVPTLIFLDSSGKEIAQEVGYKSADEVLQTFAKAGVKI